MNILKINGQALEGIYVDAAISFNKPAKRVSTYSVPGRNGDLVIDEGTFDNVLITYPVFEKSTFPTKFDEIVNYLASLEGYQRIECSNDPQHFRLGRFVVPQDPTAKRLNRDGYWQLSFDCKPQRWLLSGEEETEIDQNPIDEYSGALISFEGTALDEITELKANITPVQSLNGQTSPYPAGGGGNLWSATANAVERGAISSSSGAETSSTTRLRTTGFIAVSGSTEYTISVNSAIGKVFVHEYKSDDSYNYISGNAWKTPPYTFTTQSTTAKLRLVLAYTDDSTIQTSAVEWIVVNAGATAIPYSNICPITGWSAANVYAAGVNGQMSSYNDANNGYVSGSYLKSDGTLVSSSGWYITEYIPVIANTQVRITAGYANAPAVCFYDSNHTYLYGKAYANASPVTATAPTSAAYMRCSWSSSSSTFLANIRTYPISFGQTVYGGTLNVTTGVLTVTHGIQDLGAADLTWYYTASLNGAGAFYLINFTQAKLPSVNTDTADMLCSMYKVTNASALYVEKTVNGQISLNTQGVIQIRDFAYTDPATFKTAMSGVQLVYELATPTTVQLTAAEVETLLGQNNIWADTGDVEVNVTTPTVFNNPSLFNSKPLIRVYGIGTFRVNDITVTIASHDKPYIDIDCELQECYYGSENMNEYVSFSGNDFPELQPGDNYMLLASGITKLDVTPRWWVL